MKKKSQALVKALKNIDSGQNVYDALWEVPTCNLVDMSNMIVHILALRTGDRCDNHGHIDGFQYQKNLEG